jgi:hypothetical protein
MRVYGFNVGYAFLTLGCAAIIFTAWSASALVITPFLIVIEGRNRYADVAMVNDEDVIKNYEVNWKFYKMQEGTGNYLASETSTTEFDLTKNIVFTPKRAQLGPRSMQKIRLGLRIKGEPPPPGDYRAHLELREADLAGPDDPNQKGMRVSVNVNVGFTVPVVYRVGEPDVTAEIGDVTPRINPETKKIEVSVPVTLSESPYGVLGHLMIYYKGDKVGEIRNANIFPEARHRTFNVGLKAQQLSGGSLEVVLADYKDKDKIYAQKTIPVGQ